MAHVSQEEGCQTRSTGIAGARGRIIVKIQLARAVRIAGNAQVVGITHVSPKLKGMLSFNLGPVVNELVLVLLLMKRAIALIDPERVPKKKIRSFRRANRKRWHGRGVNRVEIDSRNTRVFSRRCTQPAWRNIYAIAHIAETKVCKQGWAERVIETSSN